MAARMRMAIVTGLFGVAFSVLANLAWATAIGTTGPWFSPTVSMQVYSVTLIGATMLALVVSALASYRASALGHELRSLDVRIVAMRGALASGATGSSGSEMEARGVLDDDLDEPFGRAGEGDGAAVVALDREGHDSLVAVSAAARGERAKADALRELVRQQMVLREARARMSWAVAGPLVVSIAFVGIAGAMLPGSEGFAASQYPLNTALVLFLGYGWLFLVAWGVMAMASLRAPSEYGNNADRTRQ